MTFGGEDAESYYDEGRTAAMRGDMARAVECFQKAIRLDRSFLAAYQQLAKCYLRQGDAGRAAQILKAVVTQKPDQIPPRLDFGFALMAMGRRDEARQQFTQIVALDPGNARAHLGLAQTAFDQGNWSGVLSHAEAALAQGGANFAALFLLGRAAKLAGDSARGDDVLKRADKLLEKSTESSPDQPEGHYLRGEVSFARDQFSSALEHYRAAEDRAQPNRLYSAFGESFSLTDVLMKQALCYQRLGKADQAAQIARRVLEMDPGHKLAQSLVS